MNKIFYNLILNFLMIFLIYSCSHIKVVKQTNVKVKNKRNLGVDAFEIEIHPTQNSEKNEYNIKENNLYSDKSLQSLHKENIPKHPIVGIFLGPGLLKSLAFIGVLKVLEKEEVPIDLISGGGFGLLTSYLYAKYQSTSMIEWFFFKLKSNLKNSDVFSEDWERQIEEYIRNNFVKDKIESFKIPLVVPVIHTSTKKIVFLKSGNLSSALISNVLESNFVFNNDTSSEQLKNFFNTNGLLSSGADIIIVLDVLSKPNNFNKVNENVQNYYDVLLDRSKVQRKVNSHNELYFDIRVNATIDTLDNITNIISDGEKVGAEIVKVVKFKIKNWKIKTK